ncbi:MAG: hypothetical protein KJ990_05145 [Proteobacteria bacterium]|nr:hypothetical protein [Pseudomonadota bacterium]
MLLKSFLYSLPLIRHFKNNRKKKKDLIELKLWEEQGRPSPPPHLLKQKALLRYAQKYDLKILIETGTFNGDMVEAMKASFDKIFSIELSRELFEKAKFRFKSQQNVTIIHGDSGKELKKLMQTIDQPALFWLDGHYSGGETALGEKETPIFEELECILSEQVLEHVIVIDDARLFNEDQSYPSLDSLKEKVLSRRSDVAIEIKDDSIRITPRS